MKQVRHAIVTVLALIAYIIHFPPVQTFFWSLVPAYLTVQLFASLSSVQALDVLFAIVLWAYTGVQIGQAIESVRLSNIIDNVPSPHIMIHPDMLKGGMHIPESQGTYNPVAHGEHIQALTDMFQHMITTRTIDVRSCDINHVILTGAEGEDESRIAFLFVARRGDPAGN